MNSPLKGIERLSEELRLERQKSNNALQDRARMKVEIESLKRQLEDKNAKLNDMYENLDQSQKTIMELNSSYEEHKSYTDHLENTIEDKNKEMQALVNDYQSLQNNLEQIEEASEEKESLIINLKAKIESLENRSSSKDSLINELKQEIQDVRKNQMSFEQFKFESYQENNNLSEKNMELEEKLVELGLLRDNYEESKKSNEELRADLENSIQTMNNLNQNIRELNLKIVEYENSIHELSSELSKVKSDNEQYQGELKDFESYCADMQKRIDAEIESSTAAREQSDSILRNKELLESQVKELREAHEKSLAYGLSLEEELTQCKMEISELESEMNSMKERLAESEEAMEQAKGFQSMTAEIESLRSQLTEMRKKLIKRDLEDEAGVMAPKAIIDREQNGRQVYEGIIHELRMEIDKVNSKYHEVSRRYEETLKKASRVEQLEEEIEIYKDMAKNVTYESQSVALSVSEALERSTRFSQDKQNLMHDLHRAESELQSARSELVRYREEVKGLRDKLKEFNSAKIASDTKLAESLATNSRLEISMEDLRQQNSVCALDLDKSKQTIKDLQYQLANMQIKINELSQLKADNKDLSSRLHSVRSASSNREKELVNELETLRYSKSIVENELTAFREKVKTFKTSYENAQQEITKLRRDVESLTSERDRLKRDLNHNESLRAERQLQSLRKELEQTVHDWQDLEKEKTIKDKVNRELESELRKEKEKVSLLKVQMELLEERLRVVTQELSVYRSIDVYHSSMQIELQSYRKERLISSEVKSPDKPRIRDRSVIHSMRESSSYPKAASRYSTSSWPPSDRQEYQTNNKSPRETYSKGFPVDISTLRTSLSPTQSPSQKAPIFDDMECEENDDLRLEHLTNLPKTDKRIHLKPGSSKETTQATRGGLHSHYLDPMKHDGSDLSVLTDINEEHSSDEILVTQSEKGPSPGPAPKTAELPIYDIRQVKDAVSSFEDKPVSSNLDTPSDPETQRRLREERKSQRDKKLREQMLQERGLFSQLSSQTKSNSRLQSSNQYTNDSSVKLPDDDLSLSSQPNKSKMQELSAEERLSKSARYVEYDKLSQSMKEDEELNHSSVPNTASKRSSGLSKSFSSLRPSKSDYERAKKLLSKK